MREEVNWLVNKALLELADKIRAEGRPGTALRIEEIAKEYQ